MRDLHDLRSASSQIIVWVRGDDGWTPETFETRAEADIWIAEGNTHSQFVITDAIIFPAQFPNG